MNRIAPAVIRRIDLDEVVDRLDVNAIADRLDLDALMVRLDLDAIVDRLDVNAIADRLDLDALMARLDMDTIADRLDVQAIADRLDLDRLVGRMDMAQLTAGATQDVAISGLDLARRQLVRIDATVDGIGDRLLRRRPGQRPVSPAMLEEPAGPSPEMPAPGRLRRRDVSGHYAGPVTRLAAVAGDVIAALTSYGVLGAASLQLLGVFLPIDLTISSGGWLTRVLVMSWMLAWFWAPVAFFGRTPVMALLGVAVVRRDGGVVTGRRALVRALVMPFSVLPLLLGMVGILVGRERRALHDLVAGTAVVYDWGARQAQQPVSLREQLSARVQRRSVRETPTVYGDENLRPHRDGGAGE